MKKQLVILGIIALLVCVGLSGCNEVGNTLNPVRNKFIGTWVSGSTTINIVSDGTMTYKGQSGTWDLKDNILTFDFLGVMSISYNYEFSNNDRTLTLTITLTGQRIPYTKQ